MARPKFRHSARQAWRLWSEPIPTDPKYAWYFRPSVAYRDPEGRGWWVLTGSLRDFLKLRNADERKRRKADREKERRARGRLSGIGSGRPGGGRSKNHKKHIGFDGDINADTPSSECPRCIGGEIFDYWVSCNYGQDIPKWEHVIENRLLRLFKDEQVKIWRRRKRDLVPCDRPSHLAWEGLRQKLKRENPELIQEYQQVLMVYDVLFDTYMRTHRDERSLFSSLGIPFVYDRPARLVGPVLQDDQSPPSETAQSCDEPDLVSSAAEFEHES